MDTGDHVRRSLQVGAALMGLVPALVVIATIAGLGLPRGGPTIAIWISATALVLTPAIIAGIVAPTSRGYVFGGTVVGWSIALFATIPLYFPGEREAALYSLVGSGPEHRGEIEVAEATVDETPKPARDLEDHELALPYEGDGRSLSVEIAIEHNGVVRDISMILDTGASLTTLPPWLLAELGATPPADAPVLRFQTANGPRDAPLVLLDKVWLGDMPIEGVAVSPCVACEDDDSMGLLGLNVTKGFNFTIDSDRNEVIFTRRQGADRLLDLKHWLEVDATVTRMPRHVQVEVHVKNTGTRDVRSVTTAIRCEQQEWAVEMGSVAVGETTVQTRRLPSHEPCDRYLVDLLHGDW
ncbi:MAG: putative aspartyl protease [Kiritimatiellia bacterium]|jgi:predicted aspartyl protease